jgi:P-type E1-E2 ATPase
MLRISIPGFGALHLKHLVLDYNGTLALDGRLAEGVARRLNKLGRRLEVHVLTADTFGGAGMELKGIKCTLAVLKGGGEHRQKANYVERLGSSAVVAIGNGRNDRAMLRAAELGIAVLAKEGAAVATLSAADLVLPGIIEALDLLDHPMRLVASLRS